MLHLIDGKVLGTNGAGNFVELNPRWYLPADTQDFAPGILTNADVAGFYIILGGEKNPEDPAAFADQQGVSLDDLAKKPNSDYRGSIPYELCDRFNIKIEEYFMI